MIDESLSLCRIQRYPVLEIHVQIVEWTQFNFSFEKSCQIEGFDLFYVSYR